MNRPPSQNQSQSQSQGSSSQPSLPSLADGPLPLPEESPFLSDLEPDPSGVPHRSPAVPPSALSPFPPNSTIPATSNFAGRPAADPSSVPLPPMQAAPPPQLSPIQDALSSFTLYSSGEDPYGARASQSAPRPVPGNQTELLERLRTVQTTTTDSLQGRLVEQYLGPVTAEAVVPTDLLMEGAERTGRFSRYKSSQQKLKSLEQLVLAELKLEADKSGGNAILGMELRVSMGQGVILVVATGTAVRLV